MVKLGDWVTIKVYGRMECITSFVTEVCGAILGVYDPNNGSGTTYYELDQLRKIHDEPEIDEEMIDGLIDVALLVKDREWFNELIRMKGEIAK